jgi:hypothetical protein
MMPVRQIGRTPYFPGLRISKDEATQPNGRPSPTASDIGAPRTREPTDDEAYRIGHGRNVVGRYGEPMYCGRANRGSQLRRIDTTDHGVGRPALPGRPE